MRIATLKAHWLTDVPIQPPPFREVPNAANVLLVEVVTDDGLVGWGYGGYVHQTVVQFINEYAAPRLLGIDPIATARVQELLVGHSAIRDAGQIALGALSAIDIALWDIRGKSFGRPLHELLGGAKDSVPVYVTHGAAYGSDPAYSIDELVEEAKYLVDRGVTFLKTTVGRQTRDGRHAPDPRDDYERLAAVRSAIGPSVALAIDGNYRMSLGEALALCKLTEELDLAFLEEPVYQNDPTLLRSLRSKVSIPIAAAQNHRATAVDLISGDAVDIFQPNVANDGGYTGAMALSAMALASNVELGHGNGNGPHNIALQAALPVKGLVEYHYHVWMTYNAVFEDTPQPTEGYIHAPTKHGTGLEPRDGIVAEYSRTE